MWSLAWEAPLWKWKYMYTNSESIPYYFKYLEYSYLNVTFWPIMGEDNFLIRDLKKLNCNLHEYITNKQVSIYLFVGSANHASWPAPILQFSTPPPPPPHPMVLNISSDWIINHSISKNLFFRVGVWIGKVFRSEQNSNNRGWPV